MITALCMNPAFDRTLEVDRLVPGELNRVRVSRQDVGGKGINVAVVAKRLGLEARVVGCAGQEGAAAISAMLDGEGIRHALLPIPGRVRTNLKIVSLGGSPVTELNEPGAALTANQLELLTAMCRDSAAGSDWMVLTGSLPPGCPAGAYRALMEALDTPCILDASGAALRQGLTARPFLIKPNLREAEAALGRPIASVDDARAAAEEFLRLGAQHVILSMGGLGAIYTGEGIALFAPALPVEVRSTVGAGDAMLGGVLKGMQEERDMTLAFRYGVAAGAASVMTSGTQLIVPADFARLLEQVKVLPL